MSIYLMRKEDLQIFKLIHLGNEDKYVWVNINRGAKSCLEKYKNKLSAILAFSGIDGHLFTDIEIFNDDKQAMDYFFTYYT